MIEEARRNVASDAPGTRAVSGTGGAAETSATVGARGGRAAPGAYAEAGIGPSAAALGAAGALVAPLDEWECAGFKLALEARRSRTRSGWVHFSAMLVGRGEEFSVSALIAGIASAGGRGVKPWFEVRIYPEVKFANEKKVDARSLGLEKSVIELLAGLTPPGGHLMVDYESEGQEETFAELLLGVPPLATRLGEMLFAADIRGQFKDWYFPEGGHEGPRKLQANKPPDEEAAGRALRQHRRELRAFLAAPLPVDPEQAKVIERAQRRAAAILAEFFA
jgi:hypothetical protein